MIIPQNRKALQNAIRGLPAAPTYPALQSGQFPTDVRRSNDVFNGVAPKVAPTPAGPAPGLMGQAPGMISALMRSRIRGF